MMATNGVALSASPFWRGFFKMADIGGHGFTGIGKGNLPTGTAEQGCLTGNAETDGVQEARQIRDRERDPRNYGVGHSDGLEAAPDVNPHIRY